MKSPNLRHCQAHSQNKGLRRASQLWTSPYPAGDRQGQPELEGGNHSPRESSSTKLQVGFIANQDFLGFWMVDICREGRSQRLAPQKRHRAHLRRRTHCTTRKPSGWDRGGNKTYSTPGGDCACQAPGHLSGSDLGRAQNASPIESAPLWSAREPEVHTTQGPPQTVPSRATQSLSSVDRDSTHTVSGGKPSASETLRALPTHASDICLQCSSLHTARLIKGA